MREITPTQDWIEMRENIHRAVCALEVCWKCQRVSECEKYILGNMVLVWLCQGCQHEMKQPRPERPKTRPRASHLTKSAPSDEF